MMLFRQDDLREVRQKEVTSKLDATDYVVVQAMEAFLAKEGKLDKEFVATREALRTEVKELRASFKKESGSSAQDLVSEQKPTVTRKK